jgi:hypothetical protein
MRHMAWVTRPRPTGSIGDSTDDELAAALTVYNQARAETERLQAERDAAEELAKSIQFRIDAAVAVESDAFGRWRHRLDEHDGIGVFFQGTVYPPRIDDGESFEIKHLRSGRPNHTAADKPRNGHPNGVATAPRCQCQDNAAPADTLPGNATHRDPWLAIIRRAIAGRLEARAWNQKVSAIVLARDTEADKANFNAWYAIDSTTGTEEYMAEKWLIGCILAYFNRISDAGDVDELPEDWQPVVLTVDGVTYLVRGEGEHVDAARGKPILEITTGRAIEALTA